MIDRKRIFRYAIISTASLLIAVIVFFGTLEVTSKPSFCSNCHYMEPYVEGWKTSTHADVTCTDCHFPPGFKHKIEGKLTAMSMVVNYMTGIYKRSKPWAEISDASCLRSGCHEERLLTGQVYFKNKVLFDHEPHLTNLRRGKKLRCTSCHSQIVQGVHISVTESTCFTCHFKSQEEDAKIDDCTWCHEAPVKIDGAEVKYDHTIVMNNAIDCQKCHGPMKVGDGAVPKERCNSCHAAVSIMDHYEDETFIHKTHVTDHKVECQRCHLGIQHKAIEHSKEMISDCNTCHENSHAQQLALFSGTGGHDVPDHPNPMFESGLTCQACHIFHDTSKYSDFEKVSKASYESCDICHGPGYHRILNQWKNAMDGKVEAMESFAQATQVELDQLQLQNRDKNGYQKQLRDASKNINLVKTGNIVHNVAYSDELLQRSYENLAEIHHSLELEIELPKYGKNGTSKVPSECNNCHYGIEDVDISIFDRTFSHNKHVVQGDRSCNQCHTNERKHGELRLSAIEDCNSCHHGPQKKECLDCHMDQAGIYDGTFIESGAPDMMYEAEISCEDCHRNEDDIVSRITIDNCIDCHDDSYEDLLYETQDKAKSLIANIDEILENNQNASEDHKNNLTILKHIKDDGSWGAHNPESVLNWLEQMDQPLSSSTTNKDQ